MSSAADSDLSRISSIFSREAKRPQLLHTKFLLVRSNFNSPPHSGQKLGTLALCPFTNKRFSSTSFVHQFTMIFDISVKFSHENTIIVSGTDIIISIKSQARHGKANTELVKKLAKHFGVEPASVTIISGQRSRKKKVEIRSVHGL